MTKHTHASVVVSRCWLNSVFVLNVGYVYYSVCVNVKKKCLSLFGPRRLLS